MTEVKSRGARRAAARDLWRKTRRRARNQEDVSFNTMWGWVNDNQAELRTVTQQKRKAATHG